MAARTGFYVVREMCSSMQLFNREICVLLHQHDSSVFPHLLQTLLSLKSPLFVSICLAVSVLTFICRLKVDCWRSSSCLLRLLPAGIFFRQNLFCPPSLSHVRAHGFLVAIVYQSTAR